MKFRKNDFAILSVLTLKKVISQEVEKKALVSTNFVSSFMLILEAVLVEFSVFFHEAFPRLDQEISRGGGGGGGGGV